MQFLRVLKQGHRCIYAVLALFLYAMMSVSYAADVSALRSWRAPDNTRLVVDLSAPVVFRLSPESTPAKVVIEIDDSQTAGPVLLPTVAAPLKKLQFIQQGKRLHLVIETAQELSTKLFQLSPNEKYGQRLVIDLFDKPAPVAALPSNSSSTGIAVATPVLSNAVAPVMPIEKPIEPIKPSEKAAVVSDSKEDKKVEKSSASADASAVQEPEKYDSKKFRNIIVAIDAGHGGEDPGAIGRNGSHEKEVTLAIAREIKAQMDKEPGLTAVLTRTGDYFIPLPERRRLARYQHKADIFVSIHADAAENRAAKGASVFALSLKGAGTATSRFARMLAERENRSDLIGGSIEKDDDVLRNVLADMVVAGSLDHSLHMGKFILTGLDSIGSLHSRHVEQAGFAVLKEPGMVSLLVETGFISNPDEEKRLTDPDYQKKLASSVLNGIRRYAQEYPAPGTYFAWKAEQGRSVASNKAITVAPTVVSISTIDKVADSQQEKSERLPIKAAAVEKSESGKSGAEASKPKIVVRRHRVIRGENLTRLATQYQVSLSELRALNDLQDDNVRIGQVLKIPAN